LTAQGRFVYGLKLRFSTVVIPKSTKALTAPFPQITIIGLMVARIIAGGTITFDIPLAAIQNLQERLTATGGIVTDTAPWEKDSRGTFSQYLNLMIIEILRFKSLEGPFYFVERTDFRIHQVDLKYDPLFKSITKRRMP
jgi:hypothetical protein